MAGPLGQALRREAVSGPPPKLQGHRRGAVLPPPGEPRMRSIRRRRAPTTFGRATVRRDASVPSPSSRRHPPRRAPMSSRVETSRQLVGVARVAGQKAIDRGRGPRWRSTSRTRPQSFVPELARGRASGRWRSVRRSLAPATGVRRRSGACPFGSGRELRVEHRRCGRPVPQSGHLDVERAASELVGSSGVGHLVPPRRDGGRYLSFPQR